MSKNTNITNFKYIVVILSSIIIGMFVYIVVDKHQHKQSFETIFENKDISVLLEDLEFLKTKYDQTISENVNLSDDIFLEREHVTSLINEIKNKNVSIKQYQNKLLDMKSKMIFIFDENFKLRNNINTAKKNDENSFIKEEIKSLYKKNELLEKHIVELESQTNTNISSRLTFLNINATSYKTKNSGKKIATESARRANLLVINYTINKNKFTQLGLKKIYIQIVDPNNKIVNETKTTLSSEKVLLYTFSSKIVINNKTDDFSEQLPFSSFIKGKYLICIYDEDGIVAKTILKMK